MSKEKFEPSWPHITYSPNQDTSNQFVPEIGDEVLFSLFQTKKGTELDDIGLRIKRHSIPTTNTRDWTDYNSHDPGVACGRRRGGTVPCVDFYAYLTVDKERNDGMNWEDGNRNLREKPKGMQDIKTIPIVAYELQNCYPIEWGLDLDPDWFAVERLDFKCEAISHLDPRALN